MSAGDSSAESPTKSSYRRVIVLVAVIALALGFLFYALPQSTPPTQPSTELPRSGPISTYPASWGFYSSCPGFNTKGNTTTLVSVDNTTTPAHLAQVYGSIIASSDFTSVTSGHGWVIYSWVSNEGGSGNMPPYSNDIIGYFILTNGVSPNGYVTAYYDIQNGQVSVGSETTTVTVVCPTVAS